MPLFALDAGEVTDDFWRRIIVTVLVAAVTSTAPFFFTSCWARRRALKQWSTQEFLDRIIVSLNIFADGYLKIRTVLERSLEEVFLNRVAVNKVLDAARATTVDRPVMPIPKEDRWF